VPRISHFYGITIRMYWNEGAHERPHFHASYGGHSATFGINGDVIEGSLPRRATRMVRTWARLHPDELAANWRRARRLEALEPIEPLR